jgi:hypothetical protein
MRTIRTCAIGVVLSVLVFFAMQLLNRPHCLDCVARIGFPLAYMQDGTFSTVGHFIWFGFLADFSIAVAAAVIIMWVWRVKKAGKVSVD